MNVLKRVYYSFKDLELQYDNSIPREQFILQKFGGDIDIGSTILIDTIMAEGVTTADEIEMFSYLKNVFTFLIKIKDSLNTLKSFDIDLEKPEKILTENLYKLLEETRDCMIKKPIKDQKDLFENYKAIYYYITPKKSLYVDCTENTSVSVFKTISPTMIQIMKLLMPKNTTQLKPNTYYRCENDKYLKLSYLDIKKQFKIL